MLLQESAKQEGILPTSKIMKNKRDIELEMEV